MPFDDSGKAFGPGGGSPVRQLANLWLGKQFLGGDRDTRPGGAAGMRKRDWKNLTKYQKFMFDEQDAARRRSAGTAIDAYGQMMETETTHLGRRGAAETEEHGKRTQAETDAYRERGNVDVDVHGRKTTAETEAQRERMDINTGGEKTSLDNQVDAINRARSGLAGPQFPDTTAAPAAPVDPDRAKKRSEAARTAAETRKRRKKEAEEAGTEYTPLKPPRPKKPKAEAPAPAPVARPTSVETKEPTLQAGAPGQQRAGIGGASAKASYEYGPPKA